MLQKRLLSKVTVLEMGEGLAGPYTATMLGDMGANVIKVERPEGDWLRTGGKTRIANGDSTHFVAVNRNKRNLGLNMRGSDAPAVIQRLVSRADVIVSNFRPGAMNRLGLSYEDCKAINPEIIYCTISGFGQEGPYAQFPASDTIVQSFSGIMALTGEFGGQPLRVQFPLVDISAANNAVQAILLALYGKLSGEGGANIECTLMAAALSLMNISFADYVVEREVAIRQGNQNPGLAPAGSFEVEDGRFITIAILRESHWKKFCMAMNLEQLEADERFLSNPLRIKNRAALNGILAPIFRSGSSEYWLERLRAADILCGPLNTFADVLRDEAFSGRIPLVDLRDVGTPMEVIGTPIRFNGEHFKALHGPSRKGEHTSEVLEEFGFSPTEIERFIESGSVYTQTP